MDWKSQDVALFGLDWCRAWNMPLPKGVKLCKITSKVLPNAQECTDIILKEFAEVFDTSKPGLMVDHPVQIHMNETAAHITQRRPLGRQHALGYRHAVTNNFQSSSGSLPVIHKAETTSCTKKKIFGESQKSANLSEHQFGSICKLVNRFQQLLGISLCKLAVM